MQIQTGVLERTRLISNILMLLLLAGNLYFSAEYIYNLRNEAVVKVDEGAVEIIQIKNANFLKLFVDKVIKTNGVVSYEDRVQLENDVRQIKNPALTAQWELFVNSNKDPKKAEAAAADLMLMLAEGTVGR